MTLAAIFEGVKAFASILFELARTRVGNIVIAFAIAWAWSGARHDAECDAHEAAARAAAERAHAQELAREAEAARDIAAAATARVEEDGKALNAQQAVIDNLKLGIPNVTPKISRATPGSTPDPVFLDRDFISVVRQFDAADRAPAPTQSAAGLRRSGPPARPGNCATLKIFALENRKAAAAANRRLLNDAAFYREVVEKFGASD
jgi:hypothetical protein